MPISAPNPNCSPSVNAVEALTITAAASTRSLNRWAAARFVATMDSVWPVPYSLMWSIAASRPSTTATAMSIDRNTARNADVDEAPRLDQMCDAGAVVAWQQLHGVDVAVFDVQAVPKRFRQCGVRACCRRTAPQ